MNACLAEAVVVDVGSVDVKYQRHANLLWNVRASSYHSRMSHLFAVHVATTGREVARYRTLSEAEAFALLLSTKEVFLEVWWLESNGRQKVVVSRFAYGRSMPRARTVLEQKAPPKRGWWR
jgi:hypothetical protein